MTEGSATRETGDELAARSELDDLCVALHEAGHAVTAYRLRVPFESVTIVRDVETEGAMVLRFSWAADAMNPAFHRRSRQEHDFGYTTMFGPKRVRAFHAVLMSGLWGEWLLNPDTPPDVWSPGSDYRKGVEVVFLHMGYRVGGDLLDDEWAQFSSVIEPIITWGADNTWHSDAWRLAVVELAAVLLKRRTVARYTVKKVVRAAYADPNPERWQDRLEQLTRLSPSPS